MKETVLVQADYISLIAQARENLRIEFGDEQHGGEDYGYAGQLYQDLLRTPVLSSDSRWAEFFQATEEVKNAVVKMAQADGILNSNKA